MIVICVFVRSSLCLAVMDVAACGFGCVSLRQGKRENVFCKIDIDSTTHWNTLWLPIYRFICLQPEVESRSRREPIHQSLHNFL